MESSIIVPFYNNSCIFLTGATGFLGRILLEKLLRSCQVKKVYCLIRDKKNKSSHERFQQIFDSPIFDSIKSQDSNFMEKLHHIPGDCSLPGLNLSPADHQLLVDDVQVIFHVAATIRFNQSLKTSTQINIKGTEYLIDVAKEMQQLKAFVYTSTAYSNCDRHEIHEVIYKSRYGVEKFIRFIEDFDEEFLNQITPTVLGKLPNTYVLTKGLAEELLLEYAKLKCNLPVVIVRPSILSSTYREPLVGWVDSWFTIGSISVAGSYGLLRTANTDPQKLADIVPADYAANCLIASALTAPDVSADDNVPVLNYVCSVQAPITWGNYTKKCFQLGMEYIPSQCVRYPSVKLSKFYLVHRLRCFYMHQVPAMIVDFFTWMIGSNFSVRFYYRLLHNFLDDTSYFSTRDWKFHNANVQALWTKLPLVDQQVFPFSLEGFNWDEYLLEFLRMGRIHLLKESPENLVYSRRRLQVLKLIHYLIEIIEYLLLLVVDYLLLKYFQFV